MQRIFHIVNVFTRDLGPLTGNPLCVFEDATGLDTATMQALARQFNLSETTFILPSDKADARVRIFTPSYEMPFAGHPTLGTAHVVGALQNKTRLSLEMLAGVIPVTSETSRWKLQANKPTWRRVERAAKEVAQVLGVDAGQLAGDPLWVNAGKEQLVVPLKTQDAVNACHPAGLLGGDLHSVDGHAMAYVFCDDGKEVLARFFFPSNGAIVEDPATGSACANLGGWYVSQGRTGVTRTISQGEKAGRPSTLHLQVDAQGTVFVAGDVVQLGKGTLSLPSAV